MLCAAGSTSTSPALSPASSLLMHGAANHLQANFLDHAIVSMI
jgi:hypothetical protein